MPDKKLTDIEIVKALEDTLHRIKGAEHLIVPKEGVKNLCNGLQNALDLINRLQAQVKKCEKVEHFADKTIATLQAEIERLKTENQLLIDNDVSNKYPNCVLVEKGRIYTRTLEDYDNLIGDISAEAYKEFAELLFKKAERKNHKTEEYHYVLADDIVDTLKELVGDNNVQ